MAGDADLSRVAELLADRARSRMLMALTSGRELSAGVLADEAEVSRSTASEHLRRLVEGGLVSARRDGRHRHFTIAGPKVAQALEGLLELAPAEPSTSLRASTRAVQLRRARTCYDHMAGQLGVGVMSSLLARELITGGDGEFDRAAAQLDRPAAAGHDLDYRVTASGSAFLDQLGVRLAGGRRPVVRYCVDWTETRHHLAGQLGRGLRDRFLEAGWVRPADTYRALRVTRRGEQALEREFGLTLAG